MRRREFLNACAAVAGAAQVGAAARSWAATPPRLYSRALLVDVNSDPIKAARIAARTNYVFNYPFGGTPCFLLNLGRAVSTKAELRLADGTAYAWTGGVGKARPEPAARQVYLLQRTAKRPGQGLGRTTGWIHRAVLKAKGVELLGGVRYLGVDDRGLTIAVGEQGASRLLEVDNVVLCAGQEPRRELEAPLRAAGLEVHLIGGADVASELDAKRAIEQGTRLGLRL